MTETTVQYAFVAGEFSPTLYARTDLEKYDFGLRECYNFFIDYRGGASSRTGLEYAGELPEPTLPYRIFRFNFGIDIANTYQLIFGNNTLRFVQDGGFVVEASQAITGATQANPCVVTSTAHGYANGDLIFVSGVTGMTELNLRLFLVANVTANTFEITDVADGSNIDSTSYTAYISGGTAERVYTVTTPYAAADLALLVAEQQRDSVRLTHPNYPTYELIRMAATNWTLNEYAFGSNVPTPTGLTASSPGTGTAEVGFAVTAVKDGNESEPTRMFILDTIVNYTTTEGQVVVSWTAVPDVDYYNVYRTTVAPKAGGITASERLGFLGIAYSTTFTDTNILPDFTVTPPQGYNPFADGRVEHINVSAPGTGYNKNTSTVSITGDGTGFDGYPIVDGSGGIIGVNIVNGGKDYTTATVNFAGSGSGASATATLSDIGGNNPRASKIFQQRQIFGGTDNLPLGIFGSKPGHFNNFDFATIPTDGDSYEFELNSERVNPIRYFLELRQGLLAFTGSGVWNVTGGAEITVTPLNVAADAQTYIGIAPVEPIAIDNDILYVQKESGVVRALAYQRAGDVYTGIDRSLFSNHFFSQGRTIKDWAYAQAPYYLIWAVRNDGRFHAFTYLREQDVYAWTICETQGRVEDVSAIEEFGANIPYFIVERTLNGKVRKFVERLTPRDGFNAEDYMCVDSGVTVGKVQQPGTLRVSAATGTVTLNVDNATPFTSGNIGDHVRAGNGLIEITAFTSSTEVTGTVLLALTDLLPDGSPIPYNTWYMNPTFSEVGGLWHLEGESVIGLTNGNPLKATTVTNGKVTVPSDTSLAHIGLPYECRLTPLPAILRSREIDGDVRAPIKAELRLNLARGVSYSFQNDKPGKRYVLKERSTEKYDSPNRLINGIRNINIPGRYTEDSTFTVIVDTALPATVLGYALTFDVGDDSDES